MANNGRPPRFETPEQMEDAIEAYYADCKDRGVPLTMTGLTLAIGFESRSSLVDYQARDEKFSHTIKRARLKVELSVEERMLSSTGVVAGIIFNAKNNFGWRDRSEIDQSGEVKHIYEELADDKLDAAIKAREDRVSKAS